MRRFIIAIFLCLSAIFTTKVKAADCSNEELVKLRKEANEVKMVLSEKEAEMDPSTYSKTDGYDGPATYYYFDVSLTNVTEKLRVEITNNKDNEKITSTEYTPKDGVMTFKWYDIDEITKFTYTIYAKTNDGCNGKKLSVGNSVTPKFNYFADSGVCNGIEDYKYCSRFIYEDVKDNDIYKNVKNYKKTMEIEEAKKANRFTEKFKRFIKQHKVFFIAGAAIIVAGGGTVVILKQKRKRVV